MVNNTHGLFLKQSVYR